MILSPDRWSTQPPGGVDLPGAEAWLNGTTSRSRRNASRSLVGAPTTVTTSAGKSFNFLESQEVLLDYPTINGALPSALEEATIIAVVTPLTAGGTNDPSIVGVNSSITTSTLFHIRYDISQQKFWFQGRDSGENTFFNLYQAGTCPLGGTYVVAVTYRSGRQRIYINGLFSASDAVSFSSSWTFDFNRVCFGALDRGTGPGLAFEGYITFAAIYRKEFTQSQVAQLRTPKDVWGLFTPPSRRVWPNISGGANTYTLAVSGGVTFSGATPLLRERVQVPSGGITLSGTVPLLRTRALVPSGGVTFGGTAPITFNAPNIYTITPSGGVTFGGAVPLRRERIFVPSGGVTFSGSASLVRTHIMVPSGGVVFSGSAPITFIPAGGSAYNEPLRVTTGSARFVRVS